MARAPKPTFAERLAQACRYHPDAPADYGQQAWIRRELRSRGEDVSSTAVSNWFAGYTRARPDLTEKLAQILNVEVAWLTGGDATDGNQKSAVGDISTNRTGNPSMEVLTVDIPIPVRPGMIVRLQGIPADLSGPEAQRIANVVLALAPAKD